MEIDENHGYRLEVPALRFDGAGNVSMDFSGTPLAASNLWSFETWFRPDKLPQGKVSLCSLRFQETPRNGPDRQVTLAVVLDGGMPTISGLETADQELAKGRIAALTERAWHYLILMLDRERLELRIFRPTLPMDVGRASRLTVPATSRRLLSLLLPGPVDAAAGLAPYLGALAEIRVWNSRQDNKNLRSQRLVGNEPGLVGYWPTGEAEGMCLHDVSPTDVDVDISAGEWEKFSELALNVDRVWAWRDAGERLPDALTTYHNTKLSTWQSSLNKLEQSTLPEAETALMKARKQLQTEQSGWETKQPALVLERDKAQQKFENARSTHEANKAETLKKLAATRKVSLSDFIVRLQSEIASSKQKIAKEYGTIYGLDDVVLDVKMVPGHAGVGIQLPEPEVRTEPGRLSTLTVRLQARGGTSRADEPERPFVEVPELAGMTEVFARRRLGQAGLRVNVVYEAVQDEHSHGRVVRQIVKEIRAGQAALDSIVTLVVGQYA